MVDFTLPPEEVLGIIMDEIHDLENIGVALRETVESNTPRHAEIQNLLAVLGSREYLLGLDFNKLSDNERAEISGIYDELAMVRDEFAKMAKDPNYAGRSGKIAAEQSEKGNS
ncbi:MAG: hypothetical protein WC843_04735 [Candidatus Gracilibacteria bacterium]|jgi:hypothetical protein